MASSDFYEEVQGVRLNISEFLTSDEEKTLSKIPPTRSKIPPTTKSKIPPTKSKIPPTDH
jgi:hypothetical protein